jgi:hypothetical protein
MASIRVVDDKTNLIDAVAEYRVASGLASDGNDMLLS